MCNVMHDVRHSRSLLEPFQRSVIAGKSFWAERPSMHRFRVMYSTLWVEELIFNSTVASSVGRALSVAGALTSGARV